MTSKIFRASFFVSLIVLLISLTLIVGVLSGFFEEQIKKELEDETDYIAYAINNDSESFFNSFKNSQKRVTLIDASGKVLADTDADVSTMDNHAQREEVKQAILYGSGTSVRDSDTLMQKTVYFAKRLDDGRILRVSTLQYTVAAILLNLLGPLLLVLFAALVVSFILSMRVSKAVVEPINKIDLENPENCEAYDELSPLLYKIANQQHTIRAQIAQAQHKQEEFSLIAENMNEGLLVVDKLGQILANNSAALRLLDADKAEGSVLTLNRTSDFRNAVEKAINGERNEAVMLHGGRTYNIIASPVNNENDVAGAVILIIDVTENVEREAIRREFTANVSHELKTPLTSISGFAEIMKNGGVDEEAVKDFSNRIYCEARRLISLVNDIIRISELDEKSEQFFKENTDLLELSKEIVALLKPEAEKKNVNIEVLGDNACVFASKQVLDEMIYNICDNAIKYNKQNGKVTVMVTVENGKAKLAVSDTGIGIPASQCSRVFERFYRVDKSRSKAVGGTGLGLSIVKHGAIYNNALVSLESKEGEGTTVTLEFDETK